MIAGLVKKTALTALRSSGFYSLAANSKRRRSRLLILCYHGIALRDEHRWRSLLYVTPEQFRGRLEILRSYRANVLPLEEALERLRMGSLPPRSAVITFDDGFYDFYRYALPALKEFGFPCTVYLTTHYCRHRAQVFDLMVSYLLWKSGAALIDLNCIGLPETMPAQTPADHHAILLALRKLAAANSLDTGGKDQLCRGLAAHLGIDYDELLQSRLLQIMTPEEVAETSRAGIDIQLHTHRHRTPADRDLFLREIQDNRAAIAEFTGREASHFCYPSGVYAAEFLPWLADSGVRSATTCDLALAAPDSEPLLLPRLLDDSRIGAVEFESWICGLHA